MNVPLGNAKGFTLLELLVALGIVAVLVTVLYETFSAVLQSTKQVEEVAEMDQMARISLGVLTNELRSAYWRSEGDQPTSFIFIGMDGESGGRPSDTLRFTTLSQSRTGAGIGDPSLSEVEYELITVPGTETAVLMHREETNLLSLSEKTLEQFELAEQVSGLNFRYFDGENWADEWSASDQKRLPKAVEIQILFKDLTGRERPFTTQTDIPIGQTQTS